MTDNLVRQNVASHRLAGMGGGIVLIDPQNIASPSRIILKNNLLQGNVALEEGNDGLGGGMMLRLLDSAGLPSTPDIVLEKNTIISNAAIISQTGNVSDGVGGGAILIGDSVQLQRNRILSNTAVISVAGSTLPVGGGLYLHAPNLTAEGDVIQENNAGPGNGGGVFIESSTVTMTNVVMIDNMANRGAGLDLVGSQVRLNHPTVARNGGNEAVFVNDDVQYQIPASSFVTMTNGIMADQATGIYVADGNQMTVNGVLWFQVPVAISSEPLAIVSVSHQLVGDPLFAADGYHITDGSAARFQGVMSGVMLDVDGEGRPLVNPSLGADEYWPFKQFFPVVRR